MSSSTGSGLNRHLPEVLPQLPGVGVVVPLRQPPQDGFDLRAGTGGHHGGEQILSPQRSVDEGLLHMVDDLDLVTARRSVRLGLVGWAFIVLLRSPSC